MNYDVRAGETLEIKQLFLTAPIAAETVTIYADTDIDDTSGYDGATEAAGGDLTLAAIGTRQVAARNVVATITDADASITGGYAAVYGYDANGMPARELFTFSGGTETVTGNVAFMTVDKITLWGFTGTATAADDNIKFGAGTKFGLPMGANCTLVDVLKELHANACQTITHANINRTYGTYIPTAAPAGDHNVELWYTFKRRLR